jgi:GR25 family glycosyltransferase involved in LPS biosynthesis
MLQHLDALRHFYIFSKTDEDHCIVCEDDILISTKFKTQIPKVLKQFRELNLDVLLLAYLTTSPLTIEPPENPYYPHKEPHRFYGFPGDQWGSQMYMVSRKHAKYLIDTYTVEWALKHPNEPYSPDWIITKNGNRALLYPPLAVENGETPTEHEGQREFHRRSYEAQYGLGKWV